MGKEHQGRSSFLEISSLKGVNMEVVERQLPRRGDSQRCHFWLPTKRRQCANSPLPNSTFCGNHSPISNDLRVPCPIDPSHTVLKRDIESHIPRCPKRKNALKLEAQPFYKKGINCGGGDGTAEFRKSNAKKNDIYQLSVPDFLGLIKKIKALHSAISEEVLPLRESFILSEPCRQWIEGERGEKGQKLPFQEKHALQQAAILGNMENFGLLNADIQIDGRNNAVVEFGAGRGYLTQMLADCYGFRDVYLVERRSYKLKADRSLRQKDTMSLERLRIDKDLDLNGVGTLRECRYLAIGKHLCGPATDLTLRCCLRDDDKNSKCHGLALATCCHHLCQWDQYINKEYFSRLGISAEQFNAITWFSSWAVDGANGSKSQEAAPVPSIVSSSLGNGVEEVVKRMNPEEKTSLGIICKEMIDLGRFKWLQGRGRKADIVKYVAREISPENHLLLAS
ncbi:methyltransferase isoform X2 [Wolffia australiana]